MGEAVEVLEARLNAAGTVRVRFDRGWVSTTSASGSVILSSEPEAAQKAAAIIIQAAIDANRGLLGDKDAESFAGP